MANTRHLTIAVENYVRKQLTEKFGQPFSKKRLSIGYKANGQPTTREFDAVSEDGAIVADIKSSTGKTSGGKNPSGKVAAAYKDLYFLSLVKAPRRLLILTDPNFYAILQRNSDGKLAPGLELLHIPLSPDLADQVQAVQAVARKEMAAG